MAVSQIAAEVCFSLPFVGMSSGSVWTTLSGTGWDPWGCPLQGQPSMILVGPFQIGIFYKRGEERLGPAQRATCRLQGWVVLVTQTLPSCAQTPGHVQGSAPSHRVGVTLGLPQQGFAQHSQLHAQIQAALTKRQGKAPKAVTLSCLSQQLIQATFSLK